MSGFCSFPDNLSKETLWRSLGIFQIFLILIKSELLLLEADLRD